MSNLSLSERGSPAIDDTQVTKSLRMMSTVNKSSLTSSTIAPLSSTATIITSTDHAQYLTGVRLASILLSLTLGTFLVAIDISIIAVAIPKISTEFEALD